MACQKNYLSGPNLFGLSKPPKWWLTELRRFDPQLVLMPSQKRKTFLLARRATRSAGELLHDVPGLPQHPDTVFLHEHQMVRVCEILPGTIWDMRIFQKLAAHDTQRLGGATAVANRLDAMDAQRAKTIQADQDNEVTARAADGYKAFKYVTGARLSLATSQPRGIVTPNPVSVVVPSPIPPAPA